jgi:Ferritin-like domain
MPTPFWSPVSNYGLDYQNLMGTYECTFSSEFALTLEQAETTFYEQALSMFQASDFINAGFTSSTVALQEFSTFGLEESIHVSALQVCIDFLKKPLPLFLTKKKKTGVHHQLWLDAHFGLSVQLYECSVKCRGNGGNGTTRREHWCWRVSWCCPHR